MPASEQSTKPFRGRVALITGASRGIGREIALAFANQGCNVVIAAKSTEPHPTLPGTIHTVAAEARALGVDALPIKCDVRHDEQVKQMIQTTVDTFGNIDFLICNSGALWWRDLLDTPMSRYDLVHSVNVRATFACVHYALPFMRRNNFGRIIVMSPPLDMNWLKGKVAYCISKFGMTMIALGLAKEVRDFNISINALWPATLIESYATKNFRMANAAQWRKASILSDCVLRIVQEPSTSLNGSALIDEDYLRSKGVTDFSKYQCVPGKEPAKAWPVPKEEEFLSANDSDLPPGMPTSARL